MIEGRNNKCHVQVLVPWFLYTWQFRCARGADSATQNSPLPPGTTIANQIATVTFSPASSEETDVLFSGLDLAAGRITWW